MTSSGLKYKTSSDIEELGAERHEVVLDLVYDASRKPAQWTQPAPSTQVGIGKALIVSMVITAFFVGWTITSNADFYAQGADSLQYLDILRILQGRIDKVTSLDQIPVGVLNRTALYPSFLWCASIFAGNNAFWLTILSNAFSILCTLPLILRVFGARFGLSAAVTAYTILACAVLIYFRTISAEWLFMHLLLVIGAIFLDTEGMSSKGAGFRMGLWCACVSLCRPIETAFAVLALFLIAARRDFREFFWMLLAYVPIALNIALQSYIAGFPTLSQISIISDYLMCSQLGEVSIQETDSPLLQAFIVDANMANSRFDDNVLRQSISVLGVSEGSSLYLEGVKNQDSTLIFKQRWNISYRELNKLIKEYNKRARHAHSLRHKQYLLSLWPLGVALLGLAGAALLIRHFGVQERQFSSLMVFYLVSMILVLGYTAYCSLPVTRYVLIQAFPLVYIFLVRLLGRVFSDGRVELSVIINNDRAAESGLQDVNRPRLTFSAARVVKVGSTSSPD